MTCCGKKRRAISGHAGGAFYKAMKKPANPPFIAGKTKQQYILFEYTGRSSMTVRGPFSGNTYRFESTGDILKTDPVDYPVLQTVPGLRVKHRTG